VGDPFAAAVELRAVGVPRVEDRTGGQVQLAPRILGELRVGVVHDDLLELLDELLQVLRLELDVGLDALPRLGGIEGLPERLAVDAEHGLAEHLDQPAVGVPGEPLVARRLHEPEHGMVVEPHVQDGLHHPGHGVLRARAHAHQQRIGRVAESTPDLVLQLAKRHGDLHGQLVGLTPLLEVEPASLGRDREARRHRQT
jgi:hypothetical protein